MSNEYKELELNGNEGLTMNQLFFWKAIDAKGTINEMDIDGTEHSFHEIDKSSLKQFILYGPDFRIWFNPRTGEFFFDSQKIYQIQKFYNLPVDYGMGLIQYKQGNEYLMTKECDLGLGHTYSFSRIIKNVIDAHYFGYKFKHDGKEVKVLFRVIPDDPTTATPFDTKVDIQVTEMDLATKETQETIYEVVK